MSSADQVVVDDGDDRVSNPRSGRHPVAEEHHRSSPGRGTCRDWRWRPPTLHGVQQRGRLGNRADQMVRRLGSRRSPTAGGAMTSQHLQRAAGADRNAVGDQLVSRTPRPPSRRGRSAPAKTLPITATAPPFRWNGERCADRLLQHLLDDEPSSGGPPLGAPAGRLDTPDPGFRYVHDSGAHAHDRTAFTRGRPAVRSQLPTPDPWAGSCRMGR